MVIVQRTPPRPESHPLGGGAIPWLWKRSLLGARGMGLFLQLLVSINLQNQRHKERTLGGVWGRAAGALVSREGGQKQPLKQPKKQARETDRRRGRRRKRRRGSGADSAGGVKGPRPQLEFRNLAKSELPFVPHDPWFHAPLNIWIPCRNICCHL